MDKNNSEAKQSTSKEAREEDKQSEEDTKLNIQDDAGPSGCNLPGAITSPRISIHKTGLSKSEHNLRHIITHKDVANALKLSSLSFGTANPVTQKLHLKELKIPISQKEDNESQDSLNLTDLKRFMAGCFKLNKDNTNVEMPENPVEIQNVEIQNVLIPELDNRLQNVSVETGKTNEVIVKTPIDTKLPKSVDSSIKKKEGSLSERSDLGVTNRDSLSSIGSNVCRICMTRGRERLISPCNCKGSLANVHLTCLERWLNQVGRNHCELCGYSYPAIRTPRYTVLQALRLWFGNPRNRSHLQSDCLIFWLLSTVTAGLLAVCIVGTQYFVIEGSKFGKLDGSTIRKDEGISHRITETAMDFFMAIVLCGYSVTVYLLWKDHYVMWNRWRRANVNVRLLLTPDANPVPFVPRQRYTVV